MPTDAPLVDPHYLDDDRDRQKLLQAFEWLRNDLFGVPSLLKHTGPAIVPPAHADRKQLDQYITEQATSGWHMVGTCRLGTDGDSVVDPDLAVHGIQGLHVADASVMPRITRGNTQAPTIMIAEKAAELITQ